MSIPIFKINKKEFDTQFKYDYTSIARSYLFELSDEDKSRINQNSRIIAQRLSSETKQKNQQEREGFEEPEM